MYKCSCGAPSKVWYKTDNGLWASREWYVGEKAQYEHEVLGR